jgi:hypothetical protein
VEFSQITGGASPPVLLVTAPSLITIWLPLSLVATSAFIGAAVVQAFLRDRFPADRRRLGDSLVMVSAILVISALILLGLSTPTNVNPFILWAPAVVLGLAGWSFPEINHKIGQSASTKPSSRSVVLFLLIAWASLLESLVLGVAYNYSLLPGLLSLLSFMLLRASIVVRGSTRDQQK